MIVASGIELRAGARLLLAEASFKVAEGDRIGLVGRNGAGAQLYATGDDHGSGYLIRVLAP